jgi:ClpP class serine protease
MTETALSLPDIAEQLMHEFRAVFAMPTVTEVVLRLATAGGVDMAELGEHARRELAALADALRPVAAE